jgi:hypothetical protein
MESWSLGPVPFELRQEMASKHFGRKHVSGRKETGITSGGLLIADEGKMKRSTEWHLV